MTEKKFYIDTIDGGGSVLTINGVELGLYETCDLLNELYEENQSLKKKLEFFYELNKPYGTIIEENKRLKSQLYCDDEEGVCNICKHHYLIKNDEAELGYYNSRCKKGHYECARVSLKYCEDFEKELEK